MILIKFFIRHRNNILDTYKIDTRCYIFIFKQNVK